MAEVAGLDQLLVNEFTEETEQYLNSLNLVQLFETLKLIQQKIEQNMQANSSLLIKTRRSYGLRSDRDNESEIIHQEKMLLFEAYEIIQLIRARLTNQQLTYRLYITAENAEGVSPSAQYIDVANAVDLFQYLGLNSKEISITASKVQAEIGNIEDKEKDSQRNWFEAKYATVLNLFRHPSDGTSPESFFVLKIPTVLPQPPHPREKKNGQNVVYTRGHIIEALDAVYRQHYSLISESDQPSESEFINLFGHELGYDNVSGFKGGDTGMVQIKANAARLMRYTTIMNAISRVLIVYNLIANPGSKGLLMSEISQKIHRLYSNSRAKNEVSKISDKMIDDFVNKILSELNPVDNN